LTVIPIRPTLNPRQLLPEDEHAAAAIGEVLIRPVRALDDAHPDDPGVYALVYRGGHTLYQPVVCTGAALAHGGWPIYVGAAARLRERLRRHRNNLRGHPTIPAGDLGAVWLETASLAGAGLPRAEVTSDLWCRRVPRGRMCTMPKPYPKEFRDEVVRVARSREEGVRLKDIAADFGITESCLNNWLAQARDENQTPEARSESVELREARKRIRLLEQENEVLRRAAAYLGQANLPKG
jgi:transposase